MANQRSDVVLVMHHPPAGEAGRQPKMRPMAVVSSATFHAERPRDVLAALITTKARKYRGATDYALKDWSQAGLHQPSVVRATLIIVEQGQLGVTVGHLSGQDLAGVDAALRQALDLPAGSDPLS